MPSNEIWLAAKVLELDERVADLYRRLDLLADAKQIDLLILEEKNTQEVTA